MAADLKTLAVSAEAALDALRQANAAIGIAEARAEAAEAALAVAREENERLRGALAEAKAAILAADVMDARHNAAGYLTDRALWHDRAMTIIEAALSPRTAAMEHIAKELAEEIEEGRNA